MAKKKKLHEVMLPGEREMLSAVVANLGDDAAKLVYADWLEEQGDSRAVFLRAFVKAAESMNPADFPPAKGIPFEWQDLIGYHLLQWTAEAGLPELKKRLLRLARPALRMEQTKADEGRIPRGASKVGGLPDLPPDFSWPRGGDCKAVFNDDAEGEERLAGFLAQINFAEITHTQAGARDLPATGLLSFFCFQDIENDNPDVIVAGAIFFPDPKELVRTKPPQELTEGNGVMPARRLTFAETLDLPDDDGPWSKELKPKPDADYSAVLDHFRLLNFENFLGYARATSGPDPTPSKKSRHLILLENAAGCRLHIQILQKDLSAQRFDQITLNWVDFD